MNIRKINGHGKPKVAWVTMKHREQCNRSCNLLHISGREELPWWRQFKYLLKL
jgi:hypothetical protein